MNQASRLSCVVPVLPATAIPCTAAARPVPRDTVAAIMRRIASAASAEITGAGAGGSQAIGRPSARASATP